MPELPEVETIAAGVNQRVRGRNIVSVFIGNKPEPLKSPRKAMLRAITGRSISQVHRVGKTIVFDLNSAAEKNPASGENPAAGGNPVAQFLVHLGMTGRLLVSQAEVPIPAHTHAILRLDDQREVRFVDARRFGRLSVLQFDDKAAPESAFTGTGLEPLTISADRFVALFQSRRAPIKALLLNQTLLHGVGNIYADESLFHAKIFPTRQAALLTRTELLRLRRALQTVLQRAIATGGSSVSDYVDADGVRGFFQLEHCVYMRTGEPCRACKTIIVRTLVGGRGTHFCPRCQC